jgi:NAD(P)-dependent dehydrogenase (short-subunit alcohol dehydrogenase family)
MPQVHVVTGHAFCSSLASISLPKTGCLASTGAIGRRAGNGACGDRPCRESGLFVEKALETFDRLDIVVNNAAYQQEQQSILDVTPEQLDSTFRTNTYGYFYMAPRPPPA